ncbi:YafY family protein [Luteococcus peritonei]|uniref:YafY family protein n=1 Tax=Luteococcus peritonei TaxID=88874 RepID=A0ABW4RWS1_9ACTN
MSRTTHRVLRLLALLESRRCWQGHELADRLEVTERTVRRDVTRLREIGYPVEADRGLDGGYRLGAGRRLPPLMLDDDEAVALVACLRMAALQGQDAMGEAALRALAKLDQVLPPRLRALATALDEATGSLPRTRPAVDWQVLSALATARRDQHVVRFRYTKPDGSQSLREVEPARLLTQGEHWYLQAHDRDRDQWRVFRVDRIDQLQTTTWRCAVRVPPPPGFDCPLSSRYPCVVAVELAVDADRAAARIPAAHREGLEPTSAGCRMRVGGADWDTLAWHLMWVARDLGVPLVLTDDEPTDQLRRSLDAVAEQARQASASPGRGSGQPAH